MNEKVSIIIPYYDQPYYLKDAVLSAVSQTYKDVEVIVVDDGSPNSPIFLLEGFPQVKYLRKENGGLASARNAGIKVAEGYWIVCLDADDMLAPEYIQTIMERAHKPTYPVGTGTQEFGNSCRKWKTALAYPTLEDFLKKNRMNYASMYPKEVWSIVGGYDEQMRIGFEDWDFWIRAAKVGFTMKVLDTYLFLYRKHGASMFSKAMERRGEILHYMSRKYGFQVG